MVKVLECLSQRVNQESLKYVNNVTAKLDFVQECEIVLPVLFFRLDGSLSGSLLEDEFIFEFWAPKVLKFFGTFIAISQGLENLESLKHSMIICIVVPSEGVDDLSDLGLILGCLKLAEETFDDLEEALSRLGLKSSSTTSNVI